MLKILRTRLLLAAAALLFAGGTQADVLLDRSPLTTDAAVLTDNADNLAGGQNFAERISFSSAVSLTGMDIYMGRDIASLGQSVTIRIFEDTDVYSGVTLHAFSETVDAIDLVGASATTQRVYAEFTTPVGLDADTTYWIGMSGNTAPFNQAGLGAMLVCRRRSA